MKSIRSEQNGAARRRPSGPRSGIALVIVLALLAVLVILGISFAISMRVERLASRNYLDVVKARQIVHVGLTRALDAANTSIAANMMLPAPGYLTSPAATAVPVAIAPSSVALISGQASNYVPTSITPVTMSGWQDITEPGGTKVGRVAYEVIDCSGLIDVNLGYTNYFLSAPGRGIGASADELYLDASILTELRAGNELNVKVGRLNSVGGGVNTPFHRIETEAEIWPMLGNQIWPTSFGGAAPFGAPPANFFCFSRFPPGWWDGTVARAASIISSNDSSLWVPAPGGAGTIQDELAAAVTVAGDDPVDKDQLFANLVDYVDADFVPGQDKAHSKVFYADPIPTFCTEPNPMINEFVLTGRVVPGSGTPPVDSFVGTLDIELFYPFPRPPTFANPSTYTLRAALRLTPGGNVPFTTNFQVTAAWPVTGYQRVGIPINVSAAGGFAAVNAQVAAILSIGADRVDGQTGAVTLQMSPTAVNQSVGKSVDDPRLNWDPTLHWISRTPTLGAVNEACSYAARDGSTSMYVRNAPMLTVGELGLLRYSQTGPWKTIRLLDGPGGAHMPVLDRFTLATNTVRRGLVNPNSYNARALATVFMKVAAEEYPNDASAPVYTAAQATTAGNSLLAHRTYQNLSDIGRLGEGDAMFAGLANSAQREGVVRNISGLLSPRQNLFTIIVAGQTLKPDVAGTLQIMGEQRAVVVVWRDPYRDANGRYPSFVRTFKWLME